MAFEIKKITSSTDVNYFHELPFRIHRGNAAWMPPLRFEIEKIFDPDKNDFFKKGTCERYLVLSGTEVVGRFAVMNNPEKDDLLEQPMGGIGFIEFFNDEEIFAAMLGFAREWHKKRGYQAMRGPINFAENDTFWGLLIDNYEEPPVYGMHYHPPYYKKIIENTGAIKLDDHLTYAFHFDEDLPERLVRISQRIKQKSGVEIRMIDPGNLQRDANYIREIYNKAWANQSIKEREGEFTELTEETVQQMISDLKPILMKEAVPLIFVDKKPASFIVSVPNLNELSQKTGGKLQWWNLWRLLFFKKKVKRLRVLALGTVPEYRNRGLEALGFVEGIQWVREAYPNLELLEGAWVSEKNWLMRRSLEALGCYRFKTHRTYYWQF